MEQQLFLDSVESIYDANAERYYILRTEEGGTLFNDYIEGPAAKKLIGRTKKGQRLLDIGCGIGDLSKHYASKGLDVTALDISQEMINYAISNCEGHDIKFVHADFERANIEELFPPFDIICASFMLSYFSDLETVFRKMKILKKKRGKVIVSMLHPNRLFGTINQQKKCYTVEGYFSSGFYESDFMGSEALVPLKRWNFSEIADAAYKAGLKIEQIVEPKPISNPTKFNKEVLNFYFNAPSVVLFKMV